MTRVNMAQRPSSTRQPSMCCAACRYETLATSWMACQEALLRGRCSKCKVICYDGLDDAF